MDALIYQPAKSATQSGFARTKVWVLEFLPAGAQRLDPLMGWTGSADTRAQVRLTFSSREEAERYARHNAIAYTLRPPHRLRARAKNYAAKFAFNRVR